VLLLLAITETRKYETGKKKSPPRELKRQGKGKHALNAGEGKVRPPMAMPRRLILIFCRLSTAHTGSRILQACSASWGYSEVERGGCFLFSKTEPKQPPQNRQTSSSPWSIRAKSIYARPPGERRG
jgi:hypothetical protein